ncbi:MAG: ABC transporter ATP-binding protein [Thermoflexus sp.]|jgi:branched-chain amino acid transport system ATP-binding protein|nr:ABC transporter ATP-binding protein [Thermoflexus sp.]
MSPEAEGLEAAYGAAKALHGVSLHVDPGEIVAVIGANSAGKTKRPRAIRGLLCPSPGRIRLDGPEIAGWPPERIVALGVIQIPRRCQRFASMSVKDNLRLGAHLRLRQGERKAVKEDLEQVYALFPWLKERRRQTARTLSGGEPRMLAIGRAGMASPCIPLLDELSPGLAPLLVRERFRIIAGLRQQGLTLLPVDQNARQALRAADRAYAIETGRIVGEELAAALPEEPAIQAAYLGGIPQRFAASHPSEVAAYARPARSAASGDAAVGQHGHSRDHASR